MSYNINGIWALTSRPSTASSQYCVFTTALMKTQAFWNVMLCWMGKEFPTLINIKTNLQEIRRKGMHWKCLAQDADMKQLL